MPDHPRILIVDPAPEVRALLGSLFEREGYIMAVATNGSEALIKAGQFNPHIILIEAVLPGMSGREVIRRLRQKGLQAGIILFDMIGDASDEPCYAIQEIADDYLDKPFDFKELCLRVEELLRRLAANQPFLGRASRLLQGGLVLDREAGRAYLNDTPLDLSPRTLTVLDYLMAHPGELITSERLQKIIWVYNGSMGAHLLNRRVDKLRRQLQEDDRAPRYIEAIPGQGYRFIGEVEAWP